MSARDDLLAAWRRGEPVTADMICPDIASLDELEGYRMGLLLSDRLTPDASDAIARRRAELQRGRVPWTGS